MTYDPRRRKEFTAEYWLFVLVMVSVVGVAWVVGQVWERLFP